MERDNSGKNHVYVKNTVTQEVKRVIEETTEPIRGYAWVASKRLIYVQDKGGDKNYHIYAVDLDGSNKKDLTPFEGVRAEIINELKEQPDYIIIQMNKEHPQIFEPYKINIKTGELVKLFENKDPNNPIANFEFDKDGNLRGYTQRQNGTEKVLYYRTAEGKPFEEVVRTNWKGEELMIYWLIKRNVLMKAKKLMKNFLRVK